MVRAVIQWHDIREPHLFGVGAVCENREAEVLRCYEGQWLTFYYIDRRMCRGNPKRPYLSYGAAVAEATAFLRKQVTPEVWPTIFHRRFRNYG
jgi:hypothetical protein